MNENFLQQLADLVRERKQADPTESYTAQLYQKGEDAILKKIGEEATEMILAAKSGDRDALVHEMADLWFHCFVALGLHDIPLQQIEAELRERSASSGLQEKAARGNEPSD